MLRTEDILSTIRMLQTEHLDVRAVTIGIDLNDCAGPDIDYVCTKVRKKILSRVRDLVKVCDQVGGKYKIPVVNKRLAISPASNLLEGHKPGDALKLAITLDEVVAEIGVDLVGGFSALVERGKTPGQDIVIKSLPEVLSVTKRVCSSINVATTKTGINMNVVAELGHVIKDIAAATAQQQGFGCAKLVVFANIPSDNPFMAGAYMGSGQGDCVLNIGVSGPGVVKSAVERAVASGKKTLDELAEQIKLTAFRVTRVGELIGREVAEVMGVRFGIVDLSLAPTPAVGDSIGEIFNAMGIKAVGAPGSTAALAMLNDAVKKGGLFASSSCGGLSGAFIPVLEDSNLAQAARDGYLSLAKLEAMTCVCSVGLDMLVLPGDITPETLSAIIADEMAIGMINSKTTAARLIPVPGAKPGDEIEFGGLFGAGPVLEVVGDGLSSAFIRHGGQIPAPVHSLRN
ncbi:MAG: PFL family protein [Sedimentisphaerales bacterium]|nr:PFL family protein [Sedimentisphaerales bacterium]